MPELITVRYDGPSGVLIDGDISYERGVTIQVEKDRYERLIQHMPDHTLTVIAPEAAASPSAPIRREKPTKDSISAPEV